MTTRTHRLHHAAHMLPDGPFTETEIAELLISLHYIRMALGPDNLPDGEKAAIAYGEAWDQIHDKRAANESR